MTNTFSGFNGWRRSSILPILVVTAPIYLDGCVSVGISRSKLPPPKPAIGTVEVKIYETPSERERDHLSTRKVISELVRSDVKPEQTVYRGDEAHYTLPDLLPGRYRLTALAVVDERGKEKDLSNQDSERFRLRAGERIAAVIVLKKAPLGAIVGVSAGVAGVLLLLAALAAVAAVSGFDREPMVERPEPTPPPTPRHSAIRILDCEQRPSAKASVTPRRPFNLWIVLH